MLRAALVLSLMTLLVPPLPVQSSGPPPSLDAAELRLALDRLEVLGSVLYVAAHPDDENTALLAYLARGRRARTAYLSVTRGDGGQNLIGPETGELLGMIRTQELLAARREDGAEQLFTRAIDFGYTKSAEETLRIWGHDEILGDVVRVFRRFRPDVVIIRFPGDGRGRHGQHTASAILALEAFAAAADPARYPGQLGGEGLEPWQAKRLLWDSSRFFGAESSPAKANEITIDVGAYEPLLGESYGEIAARSRSMHKSQGFGAAARRGSRPSRLEHRLGDPASADLFDGVDTTWRRVPGGEEVGALLAEARRSFDATRPADSVSILARAWTALEELPPSTWVTVKRAELAQAIRAAAGLWLAVLAERPTAAAGEEIELVAEVVNRSRLAMRLVRLELPFDPAAHEVERELPTNEPVTVEGRVAVPAGEPPTQPYWLRSPPLSGRYAVDDPVLVGLPEEVPHRAVVTLALELDGQRQELAFELPVLYRFTDRVDGERWRPFAVTPPVVVEVEAGVQLFRGRTPREVGVLVRRPDGPSGDPLEGRVRLVLPPGWRATPESLPFALVPGEGVRLVLEVVPPAALGEATLRAEAVLEGSSPARVVSRGMRAVEYTHIPTQVLFPPAEAKLVRCELHTAKRRLAYVMGAGDEIPEALRGIGYEVALLDDEQLATGELGEYEAIVVGVRAYNVREKLREHNDRLLGYVEAGGTLVVQYNTASRRGPGLGEIGPYPFEISRERVSVETAPVVFAAPEHPVLEGPNRIGPADFEGWVQERGLYFAGSWDDRYTPLLASHDPGEPDRLGGLLVARYGKGVYVYTGYSFFRQLPAGVPGAFRLFVNLVEAGGRSGG